VSTTECHNQMELAGNNELRARVYEARNMVFQKEL
jgi:hypothetical protein